MELSDLRSTMPDIIQGIALQDSNKCLFSIVKPAGMTCGFLLTGAGDLCYNLRNNKGKEQTNECERYFKGKFGRTS